MEDIIKRQLIVGKLKNRIDKAIDEDSKTIEIDVSSAKWILKALITHWKNIEDK